MKRKACNFCVNYKHCSLIHKVNIHTLRESMKITCVCDSQSPERNVWPPSQNSLEEALWLCHCRGFPDFSLMVRHTPSSASDPQKLSCSSALTLFKARLGAILYISVALVCMHGISRVKEKTYQVPLLRLRNTSVPIHVVRQNVPCPYPYRPICKNLI